MGRVSEFMMPIVGIQAEKPGGEKVNAEIEDRVRYPKSRAKPVERGEIQTGGHILVDEIPKAVDRVRKREEKKAEQRKKKAEKK